MAVAPLSSTLREQQLYLGNLCCLSHLHFYSNYSSASASPPSCHRRYRSLCLRCLQKDRAPRRRSHRRTHRTQYSHSRYSHSLSKGWKIDWVRAYSASSMETSVYECTNYRTKDLEIILGQCKFLNRFCVRFQGLETFSYLCKTVFTGC